ncbi:hypothetical protein BH11ACT2_BH11ACT2_13730 [soil metagenome]
MKTRARVLGVLASIGVLAVGWEVGASAAQTTTTTGTTGTGSASTGTTSTDGSGSTSSGLATTGSSSSGTAASSSAKDGTYTGSVASTRFGDVQVSVTIASGTITDVTALKLTDREQRSVQISNEAAPLLKAEVLQAQSANVSTIGGATYTSDGYLSSLQSALDKAGF